MLSGPVVMGLGLMTWIVLARIVLRKNWLTFVVLTGIMVTALTLTVRLEQIPLATPIAILLFTAIWGSLFFTAIRFGLLAVVFAALYTQMSDMFRIFDPSAWFFPYVLAYLILMLLSPALYAFWISLGGKKLVSGNLLDG